MHTRSPAARQPVREDARVGNPRMRKGDRSGPLLVPRGRLPREAYFSEISTVRPMYLVCYVL